MIYGVGVGMRLVRISVGVWGTPAFWDTIGWWHNEVHYTIPRLKEEKRVAAELELAFGEATITLKDQRVVIDPCKSSMGQWQWESVGVRTGRVPTSLRRLLMWVLVGAEWVPDTKDPVSLGAEYDRLQEFIDSLQSCPMEV